MYSTFFGLRTNPFLPLSDPETILRSTQVRETLQHFLYARENHHAIFLLTGEVGTGKTTAIQAAVKELPAKTPVVFLPPTLSTWAELLDELCQALAPGAARESKVQKRRRLESTLARYAAEGRKAVVVVDEAHLLPDTVLESLRLLTNVRDGRHPVLQMCLVGQPELATRLRADHLRQLRQRITLRYTMMPLSLGETELYLIERLRAAGARNSEAVFDSRAVRAIYAMTGGIPREINVVADQAMTNAFVNHESVITRSHLLSVEGDFGFEGLFVNPASTTHRFVGRDSPAEVRPVARRESTPEPAAVVEAAAIGGAPIHAAPESTLSFGTAAKLRNVLDARMRSFYRAALGFRLMRRAAMLVVLAFAVVGVLILLSASELQTERAPAAAPMAPSTPAAVVKTAYAANPMGLAPPAPPEAIETPAETTVAPAAVARVTKPAPSPPPREPSAVEERYPSTLAVESEISAVVWLGDERLGTAPGSFSPVPPGRYHVKLEQADGRIFSKDVIVTTGSTTYVRAHWSEP